MIILDFLFKICFAPVSKFEDKGRLIAVIWLSPPLSFLGLSLLNIFFFYWRPYFDLRLSAMGDAVAIGGLTILIMFFLNSIYVKGKRTLGENFHPAIGLLIPVMIVGSLIVFVMSLKYS